jgi:hypothetical protein
MRTRIIALSLVLASLMAFTSFSVASADGPIIIGPSHYEGSDVLADCGSFQVLDVYDLNQTEKAYFNKEGNLVKVIIEAWGTDTLTNSVTGKAYAGSFHNSSLIDFSTTPRRSAIMGVIYRVTVPGVGVVFLDVGRVVFERGTGIVFQAGPHQLFDGDFEALWQQWSNPAVDDSQRGAKLNLREQEKTSDESFHMLKLGRAV